MKLNEAKKRLLESERIRKSFNQKDVNDLKIRTGLQILELRLLKNVTQAKLARLIGTEQPSIARAERGAILPSLSFLHKIASVLNTELIPAKFAAVEINEMLHQKNKTFTETISSSSEFKDNGISKLPVNYSKDSMQINNQINELAPINR